MNFVSGASLPARPSSPTPRSRAHWRAVATAAVRIFSYVLAVAVVLGGLWDIVVDASITAWVLGWLT